MKQRVYLLALLPVMLAAGCEDARDGTVGEEAAEQYNEALDKAGEAAEKIEASAERIDAALDESTDDDED